MQEETRRAGWWVCGLLFLATVLNYVDRQVMALTAEHVMAEFRLNKEGFGGILAAFRYSYAVFQLAGGWLVDVFGARAVYPLAVGVWSLAGASTGFAGSLPALAASRFLLGVGEAFNWPCALQVTERLIGARDRALANGLFNSGSAIGAMCAPFAVTYLTLRHGWRACFVITGAAGALWILLWLIVTAPLAGRLHRGSSTPGGALLAARDILRKRAFWALAVSAVVVNSVSYFLADWAVLYLKTERGFGFVLGNTLALAIYAGLDAGNLLSGFTVRRLVTRGWSVPAARWAVLFTSCVLMTFGAGAGVANRYFALACLVLTALGAAGFLVMYLSSVQDLDPAHVGVTSGLLGGLGNLSYGLLTPYIGRLSDLHRTYVFFLFMGALPWLAFAAMSRISRPELSATDPANSRARGLER